MSSNRLVSHHPLNPGRRVLPVEELLHGGLLDGPLLGDQCLQRREHPIHIRQRLGNGHVVQSLDGSGDTDTP